MVLVCVVVGLLIFFFLFFHASVVTAAGPVVRATRAAMEVLVGCSLTVSEDMLCSGEGWGGGSPFAWRVYTLSVHLFWHALAGLGLCRLGSCVRGGLTSLVVRFMFIRDFPRSGWLHFGGACYFSDLLFVLDRVFGLWLGRSGVSVCGGGRGGGVGVVGGVGEIGRAHV